jgi:hypothetical protein
MSYSKESVKGSDKRQRSGTARVLISIPSMRMESLRALDKGKTATNCKQRCKGTSDRVRPV